MTKPSANPPIRRVVTGHDANKVAKVLMDAPATNSKGLRRHGERLAIPG